MTIGSISIAFRSDLKDLEDGIEQAVELIEELSDSIEGVNETLDEIEKRKIEIETAVNRQDVDSVQKDIESSSATLAVKTEVDTSPVGEAVKDIEKQQASARVEIKIDLLVLEKVLDSLNTLIESLKENILDLGKQAIGKLLAPLATPFKVAGVMAGSYSKELKHVADETEHLINLSSRFGMAYNSLELIASSASAAGVSMGLVTKAAQSLYQNISKVRFGQLDSESAREAQISLSRLGITVDELSSMSPEKTFETVANRLSKVEDAADRAAIAFDLFGKQGAAILPALSGMEEVRQDMERFGAATSAIDLSRLEGLDKSFDRLSMASSALSTTMVKGLVPIQTGWNNFLAELKGGFNQLMGPAGDFLAMSTTGFEVLFEVVGRGINILLRLAGAAAKVLVALSNAPLLAVGWKALGSAVMDVYSVIERLISVVEAVAGVISSQLTPSAEKLKSTVDISAPAESVSAWFQKLLVAAKYLGIVVVSLGVTQAAVAAFGATSSATSTLVVARNLLMSISFTKVMGAAIAAFKTITVGATGMAAKYVASMITMGTTAIAGFLAPFLASVASFVTGNAVMATSATVTGYAMAAAWAIGTLGISLIITAIMAVISNFDDLYEYFANFSENAERLLTFDGIVSAARAVVTAIAKEFAKIFGFVSGIFTGIGKAVLNALVGVKMPESINAAKADAEKIADVRKKAQEAELQRQREIAKITMSGVGAGAMAIGFVADMTGIEALQDAADSLGGMYDSVVFKSQEVADETEKIVKAVNENRDAMNAATVDAARFGDAGKEAALKANEEFRKLQQKLADNTLSPEKFEEEAARIRATLQQNLSGLDVLTDNDIFEFAKKVAEAGKEARREVSKIGRGQDLGSTFSVSRFYPTSDEIKEAGVAFQKEFEARNKAIAKKLAEGGFGEGQSAQEAAEDAFAASKEQFEIDLGKIKADTSFAADIRKSLEEALLDPTDKFEKRLREIADNKSLTALEKSRAEEITKREFVKSTFGETAGDSLREKQRALDRASEKDRFGNSAFSAAAGGNKAVGDARASAERTKLDIEKRRAAGLDATPAQSLKAGVDTINDAFGVTGKTMAEIQASLSPQEFAEYQKAIKQNTDKVKESLGVEKTGAQKFAESREKLDQAMKDGVINAEERDKALKKQRDSLLSSLGIDKSPAEDFQDAVEKIRENAAELSPDEIAKGLKAAKDKLLSALGIDKSPAEAASESLKKLNEAFAQGQITQEEFAKGAQKARDTLLQSLGIPLDPVNALRDRMNDLQEAFSQGLITQKEFAKGQEEARRSMIPGGEAKSPVEQFRDDLDAVNRAVEQGLISEQEGAARKLNLQADLQENMKPALDNLQQDRRQVGASDVRSREGVDTFFRILQGRDNPSLKAQLEIARNTRLLAQAAQDPDAAPVIAQLSAR